ncbi:hypothetical protein [Achromobacter ruhlandii]|uniref:glycine-rich domain-containing protein n=1 Tax=Achromobacter ruhlandii TaxID=72557 RepID=UPI000AFE39B6|nr:hypothetical protein [Achromobacter ruhlandii]
MQASNSPRKSGVPFANSGTKNTIPVASQIGVTPGAASFTDGFPPLTMTPLAAGGVPPYGADFNGILNFLSDATRWAQAGGGYTYDAAFSAAIGGYPNGAILARADRTGFWQSTVDNNTTNPDAGGAGWVNPIAGALLRTSVYRIISGTQQVSVNGGAFTTTGATTFSTLAATARSEIQVQGGGGAGGSSGGTNASTVAAGGGGGSGGYGMSTVLGPITAVAVTVGAGGSPGIAGIVNGGNGGSTSVGSLLTGGGGSGGPGGSPVSSFPGMTNAGGPGTSTNGNMIANGGAYGGLGLAFNLGGVASGNGASSVFGGGGGQASVSDGDPAKAYGAGGGGGATAPNNGAGRQGGAGGPGIVIIREYA